MCNISQAITTPCGPNPAGISKIWLTAASNVQTLPAVTAATHQYDGDIIMVAGQWFWGVSFLETTARFKETITGPFGGQSYSLVVEFTVAGNEGAKRSTINGMLGGRYIAVAQYVDGRYGVLGTKTTPLRLEKVDYDTGVQEGNDVNGFKMELKGIQSQLSPFWSGSNAPAILN
jgi:hypothetical protein